MDFREQAIHNYVFKYPEHFTHPLLEGPVPPPIPSFTDYMGKKLSERTGYSKAIMKGIVPVILEEIKNYFMESGKFEVPGLMRMYVEHRPEKKQGKAFRLICRESVRPHIYYDKEAFKIIKKWRAENHPAMRRMYYIHLKRKAHLLNNPEMRARAEEVSIRRAIDKHERATEINKYKKYEKMIKEAGEAAANWERNRLIKAGLYVMPEDREYRKKSIARREARKAKEKALEAQKQQEQGQ